MSARWRAPRPSHDLAIWDQQYLAGLVEGEGCFTMHNQSKYPSVRFHLNMTDEDVVTAAWERSGRVGTVQPHKPGPRSVKPQWRWVIGSQAEVAWMMDQLYEALGSRRRAKIDELREHLPAWAKGDQQ